MKNNFNPGTVIHLVCPSCFCNKLFKYYYKVLYIYNVIKYTAYIIKIIL